MSSGRIILVRVDTRASLVLVLVDKLVPFIQLRKVLVALPKESAVTAGLEARALEQNAKVSGVILGAELLGDFTQQLHLVIRQALIVFELSYG